MKETFASEVRPETLNDVIGQTHIKTLLNKMIEEKTKISLLLYGKPGIGKTSMAYSICNDMKMTYSYFNAATGNKKELVELINMNDYLIIDEIHRLNKDKQDILLPAIEFGKISIIATTTENPYFVVNPAIRSRLHILELKELNVDEIISGMKNVIKKQKLKLKINDKLLMKIAQFSNGDYRYCLNILNLLEKLFSNKEVDESTLKIVMPSIHFYSDRNSDGHFNLLSAFHKSLRGSDVNASLYYLAQLIESGDILGLERRMLAVAYEDIGLANPNIALRVATAIDAAKKLGFPEAKLPLANAVIELAKENKSNSAYLAINAALEAINNGEVYEMPKHIMDGNYSSSKKLGRNIGYKYPHDFGGIVDQEYLPKELKDRKFYKKNKNDKI